MEKTAIEKTAMQLMIDYVNGLLQIEDDLILRHSYNLEAVKNIKDHWETLNRIKQIGINLLRNEKTQIKKAYKAAITIDLCIQSQEDEANDYYKHHHDTTFTPQKQNNEQGAN